MTPAFACPGCRKAFQPDAGAAGGVVACPNCGRRLRLPPASSPVTAAPMAIPVAVPASPAGPPDEDEATLRAELPDAFFPEAESLGRPRYRVERTAVPSNAYKPAVALFLCCIPCLLATLAENVYVWPRFVFGFFVAAFVVAGVWYIVWQNRKGRVHAVVRANGFVHYDGLRYHCWRWDDIVALNSQAYDLRTFLLFSEVQRTLGTWYQLRHRDGTAYEFYSVRGPRSAQFGLEAEQETFRRMLPAAQARLQSGQSVPFSPFEMRADGLAYLGQFTPWNAVRPARLERGQLRLDGIGPGGAAASVLLEKIDNAHVFLALLQRQVKFAAGSRS